jgi:hypothetical protein
MKRKCSASWGFVAAVAAIVSLAATGVVAQSNVTYKAPRTVDGQPDLQGVWDYRTVTPLERPAEFADKEFLTELAVLRIDEERGAQVAHEARDHLASG